ncbi:MAG: hypothetical protein KDG56_18050, partial [Ottowia sp.]|nr:hypothetical protein [Ottowia sp.]
TTFFFFFCARHGWANHRFHEKTAESALTASKASHKLRLSGSCCSGRGEIIEQKRPPPLAQRPQPAINQVANKAPPPRRQRFKERCP